MKTNKRRNSGKFVSLLVTLALLCGIFQVQMFADPDGTVPSPHIANDSGPSVRADCIVTFDAGDDTAYEDWYTVIVPAGSTVAVADKPQDPVQDGYKFLFWSDQLDENDDPVPWIFGEDIVENNLMLWAAWGCLVTFDPANGSGYESFYHATVPVDRTVTDRPQDPVWEGYLFKGWYRALDANDNPIMWNFATDTVDYNMTLWAAWEVDDEDKDSSGESGSGTESGTGNLTFGSGRIKGTPRNSGSGVAHTITIGDGATPQGSMTAIDDAKTPQSAMNANDIPQTGIDGSARNLLLLGWSTLALGILLLTRFPKKKDAK